LKAQNGQVVGDRSVKPSGEVSLPDRWRKLEQVGDDRFEGEVPLVKEIEHLGRHRGRPRLLAGSRLLQILPHGVPHFTGKRGRIFFCETAGRQQDPQVQAPPGQLDGGLVGLPRRILSEKALFDLSEGPSIPTGEVDPAWDRDGSEEADQGDDKGDPWDPAGTLRVHHESPPMVGILRESP
jgi:hypothetical protein